MYSGNRSSMAGLLRACLATGSMPDLSGAKPLTLLLEMGIEKLRRDSSHYLLSMDIASKVLVNLIESINSSNLRNKLPATTNLVQNVLVVPFIYLFYQKEKKMFWICRNKCFLFVNIIKTFLRNPWTPTYPLAPPSPHPLP